MLFFITAYCEIKDFEQTKSALQDYYANKNFKDVDYDILYNLYDKYDTEHLNNTRSISNMLKKFVIVHGGFKKWYGFFNTSKLESLLPGGSELLEKMNKKQQEEIFNYFLNELYMPLSSAINKSEKIYIAFPFIVDIGHDNKIYEGIIKGNNYGQYLGIGNSIGKLNMYVDKISMIRLAFQVNGKKLLVNNPYNSNEETYYISKPLNYAKMLDITEIMYFNKSIPTIEILKENLLLPTRNLVVDNTNWLTDSYSWRDGDKDLGEKQDIPNVLAPPVMKKMLFKEKDRNEFYQQLANKISEVYSKGI